MAAMRRSQKLDPHNGLERVTANLQEILKLNKDAALTEKLQECLNMLVGLDNYLDETASEPTPVQRQILEDTHTEPWADNAKTGKTKGRISPIMATGSAQGQYMRIMSQITKARRILEIGTFTGHGAVSLAQSKYCEEVTCLEYEPYMTEFIKSRIAGTYVEDKIKIITGVALDSLQKLKEEGRAFDLVFIDADKSNYINYYNFIMDNGLLEPSGTIMADNVLWRGEVFYPDTPTAVAKAVRDFNEHVGKDMRVNQVIVPIDDGVLLIHRKEE